MRYSIVTFIESGQALVLFTLALCMLLLCVMSVVDVGFYLHNREDAQQTADAAALAGAQELPNSTTQARAVALSYVQKNGLDPGATEIGFRCTSQVQSICVTGDGRYDTIVVTPSVTSPTYFGGLLRLVGEDNCWVTGCTASATAAGCRGACGPIGTGPADIMTILDHSRSVSTSDLGRAKDAIDSMFTDFDSDYQQVGLGVTPPVSPNNRCDTVDNWDDPQVWIPATLSDDFQSSPHVLNQSSDAVRYADCVDTPSGYELSGAHTNLGTPIEDAAQELAANGRADTTWGIILLTDGAANVAPTSGGGVTTDSTGERFCTSQAAVTRNAGDNNGYETNAGSACSNGGGYATDKNSSSGTDTNCDSTQKDKHIFSSFGADGGVPADATIDGIEVRVDAWPNALGGKNATRAVCIELSWDGGSHWSTPQTIDFTSTDDTTYRIGGASDGWGHTWSQAELNNLSLRVTDVSNTKSTDFYLDALSVNVTYTHGNAAPANLGPCDWAMKQATAAKALGIEIYTIGWGVPSGDSCTDDNWNSPYYRMRATDFLAALASDSDHYFNQPKNADLSDVFSAIGTQLTTGARLVQ